MLVLGASTPVGARLCRSLLEDRALRAVMAVGLEPRERVGLPEDPRLSYHRVDLTHARPVHDLLFGTARDLGVDVVVHLAQHRANDFGNRVHVQNVESLRWLLSLAERHPTLRRLVFRSHAEVYRVERGLPSLITEDHPLELSPDAPQWVRDRVEADLLACSRMGMTAGLELAVLRCAEVLAPNEGSQLHDYLRAPVCLRSAGFDPMLNVLTRRTPRRRCGWPCMPGAPRASSTSPARTPCRSPPASACRGGWTCRCRDRCWRPSTRPGGGCGGPSSPTASTGAASTSRPCWTAPRPASGWVTSPATGWTGLPPGDERRTEAATSPQRKRRTPPDGLSLGFHAPQGRGGKACRRSRRRNVSRATSR